MNIRAGARKILIYGDSITYGRIPKVFEQYDANTRWTGILQKNLGDNYEVIEEGLRARMLAGSNPNFEDRDGLKQFGPILGSHLPLDLIVIFLGTNDMNAVSGKAPEEIAAPLEEYFVKIDWWVRELRIPKKPEVLIIAPPLINESVLKGSTMFSGGESKSKAIAPLYKAKAEQHTAFFFNAADYVLPSEIDGVHLDEENNRILATKLTPIVQDILS